MRLLQQPLRSQSSCTRFFCRTHKPPPRHKISRCFFSFLSLSLTLLRLRTLARFAVTLPVECVVSVCVFFGWVEIKLSTRGFLLLATQRFHEQKARCVLQTELYVTHETDVEVL